MSTAPLPEQPDLDQLRTRARELQRKVRAGDREALAEVTAHLPDAPPADAFPLSAAQTVLARHHRFASWPRLRRHVELINARTWTPAEPGPDEGRPELFLRGAVLNFTDDHADRPAAAARLLAAHPGLTATNLAVAAAAADPEAVRAHLAAGADARAAYPPYGWSPLMYLTYARLDPPNRLDATLDSARLLIEAGADPDDGRFFLGLPTPFTLLTGIFAGDWSGQPVHPHAAALAGLLLDAGADPNDGQTLYNRMFGRNDDFLEVLLPHGLGRGDGGPWRRLLGDQIDSPTEMVSHLLEWAVTHDQRDRVALLQRHGADVISELPPPRWATRGAATPREVALRNGNVELADQLVGYGATAARIGTRMRFVSAALAGDAAAVAATPRDVVAAARKLRPGLVVWAAGLGRYRSVELLLANGWDVNAFGRADISREQAWQTALHTAAGDGDEALVRRLLDLGADPTLRDKRFDGTARDWAEHFDRAEIVALLDARTPPS